MPTGNPDLIHQHKDKQQRVGGEGRDEKSSRRDKLKSPGRGKPDAEEGVGTVQNQKR
jgi:hypothetical protein